MMKLELKHLVPYLPYGLTVWDKFDERKVEMVGLSSDEMMLCFRGIGGLDTDWGNFDAFKPILRPLSDLDKPTPDEDEYYCLLSRMRVECQFENEIDIDRDLDFDVTKPTFLNCSEALKVYDFLFKHHFDVFGLIDAGLAIDINTIQP